MAAQRAYIFSMTKQGLRIVQALTFCAVVLSAPAVAVEVYQWTDENGVVHYSQFAPGDEAHEVETVRLEGGEAGDHGIGISEADDPEGYKAHREEMDALWANMEARREAERERQEQAPTTEVVYYPYETYDDYPYFYPGLGLRPPSRPERPPLRPTPHPQPLPSVPFKRP